jgi:sugar fermentation stimulation protein A
MPMKHTLAVADRFQEAFFLERTDNHTIRIRLHGIDTACYLPVVGSEDVLLVPGSRIFVSGSNRLPPGLFHRAVSTAYQKSYIPLDRQQPYRIARELVKAGLIFGPFSDITGVKKNPRIGTGRFDLLVERRTHPPLLVSVKLCTLCHNGVALFPDIPGDGANTRPEFLPSRAPSGYGLCILFLVPSSRARIFMPNVHSGPGFCRSLLAAENVDLMAVGYTLVDPVTVDLDSAHALICDLDTARENNTNRGSYLLVLENATRCEIPVGKLGLVRFEAGYYVYVGSGMNGVDERVARHRSIKKRHHWHIDRITPVPMRITRVYIIRRRLRLEDTLVGRLERIAPHAIQGFGSSDSRKSSHLFCFPDPPNHHRDFMDIVMDFMTFSVP